MHTEHQGALYSPRATDDQCECQKVFLTVSWPTCSSLYVLCFFVPLPVTCLSHDRLTTHITRSARVWQSKGGWSPNTGSTYKEWGSCQLNIPKAVSPGLPRKMCIITGRKECVHQEPNRGLFLVKGMNMPFPLFLSVLLSLVSKKGFLVCATLIQSFLGSVLVLLFLFFFF